MKRILAVHLLNDRSGSPFVFRQAIEALEKNGFEIELCTTKVKGDGFLSKMDGVIYHELNYSWNENRYLTLVNYIRAQIALFFKTLHCGSKFNYVYLNSVLPFGAALAAWLLRKPVIYHVHEVSIKPQLLKSLLNFVVNLTSTKNIYVSNFVNQACAHKTENKVVIYNSVPEDFIEIANLFTAHREPLKTHKKVLMLSSLKDYKGIPELLALAEKANDFHFTLVLNANRQQTDRYFFNWAVPSNLEIVTSQTNVHPFYLETDFVLNLSRTDEWLETFGMTVLEAMIYGKPVIVPPEGGVTELNENGITGFEIDCRKTHDILQCLQYLSSARTYASFSEACKLRAQAFLPGQFSKRIIEVFSSAR